MPPVAAVDPRVIYNQAVDDYKAGKYPNATSELQQYISLKPNDASALSLLGYLQLKAGKDEEALVNLKLAVKLDPADYAPEIIWATPCLESTITTGRSISSRRSWTGNRAIRSRKAIWQARMRRQVSTRTPHHST